MKTVTIVPTGTANIASVRAAMARLGVTVRLANRPEEVEKAPAVVMPGVGTFRAAGAAIDALHLRGALETRLREGKATLAICVGMQLLGERSSESPGATGLGSLPVQVSNFDDQVMKPHLGWNTVQPSAGCRYLTKGWAYFANSYRITRAPLGWEVAVSDHGGPFVSAVERGDVLACQFHPELSGVWGSQVLSRWLIAVGVLK